MNSVLSIACIIFFSLITHYVIKGYNQTRDHHQHCKTLLIPEDIDIDVALKSVTHQTKGFLRKRAMELGASLSLINNMNKNDLKIFIVHKSIEDKYILEDEIQDKITQMEHQVDITGYNEDRIELKPIAPDIIDSRKKIIELREDFDDDYY